MRKFTKTTRIFLSCLMAAGMSAQTVLPVLAQEETQSGQVIDVTAFGADPTGAKDSMPAVKKAIEAASKAEGAVTISFPEGKYQMYPDQAYKQVLYLSNTTGVNDSYKTRTVGLMLENMSDVTIDGHGSDFIFHGKMTPYASVNSTNVTFKNFNVDFAIPTTVELYTESIDTASKAITFRIPDNSIYEIKGNQIVWSSDKSPYTGNPYWTTTNQFNIRQTIETDTGNVNRGGGFDAFSNVASIEDLGGNRVKFTYSSLPGSAKTGLTWQSRNTTRDQVAAALLYSKNVTVQNVREGYVHGFGVMVQMVENMTFDHVTFDTPEGASRQTSSSADDINLSGVKGKLRIVNSTFRNPHDDPINVHGTFLLVTEKLASNKVRVRYQHGETSGFPNYFVGDQVEFAVKGSMAPVADSVRTVTAVQGPDGFGGTVDGGSGNINEIILTFDQDIPASVTAGSTLVENISYTPDVEISGNRFISSPTRGVLCTTRGKVMIENNLFDNMGMAGIFISSDGSNWYESGRATDVTIRNNTFVNGHSQDIFVQPTGSADINNPVHHNMTIENNTFYTTGNKVLDVKSTEGITFKNNRVLRKNPFSSMSTSIDRQTIPAGESALMSTSANMNSIGSNLFRFEGSSNIKFESNIYDPGLKPNIELSAGTTAAMITSTDDSAGVNAAQLAQNTVVSYLSSDPAVASVSADGQITAKKEGTAVITSYVISGSRKFIAGTKTVTVTASESDQADVLTMSGLNERVKAGSSSTLTIKDQNDAVIDNASFAIASLSGQEGDGAVTDGVFTASVPGLYLVTASKDGASVSQAVVVEEDVYGLSDLGTMLKKKADDITSFGESSVQMKSARQGLFKEQVPPDVVGYSLPEGTDPNDMTVIAKLTGFESGKWGASGLYLLKDFDHYVSIERKDRSDSNTQKMAMISETGTSDSNVTEYFEGGDLGAAPNVTDSSLWMKLVKKNSEVTSSYSTDGENWNEITTLSNAQLGEDFKIAFSACASSANDDYRGAAVEFSDLSVNGTPVALTKKAALPVLSGSSSIAYDKEAAKVSVSADASAVVVFEAADEENGTYQTINAPAGNDLTVNSDLSGKYIRAKVYAKEGSRLGEPELTASIAIDEVIEQKSLQISVSKAEINAGESAVLTAVNEDGEPVSATWSLIDPATGQESSIATISENTLNGLSGGVVLITGTFGSVSSTIPYVVREDSYELNNGSMLYSARSDAAECTSDSIALASVYQGLWESQKAPNVAGFSLPEGTDPNNLEVVVKVNGFDDQHYGFSGLYLIKDEDNYVSVERKNRGSTVQKMAMVSEAARSASELWDQGSESSAPQVRNQDLWMKLVKSGTTVTGSYSTDGVNFTEISSTNVTVLGNDFKIGLAAGASSINQNTEGAKITFSDLKVNGVSAAMTKEAQPPVLDQAQLSVSADHSSAHVETQGECIVVYSAADTENGEYQTISSMHGTDPALFAGLKGKWLKATLYPVNGAAVGTPVVTNAVELSEAVNPYEAMPCSDTRLASLSVSGLESAGQLSPSQNGWVLYAKTDEKKATVSLDTLDDQAQIRFLKNNHEAALSPDNTVELDLVPGYNLCEFAVTAADNSTTGYYRLQIFRDGDGDDSVKGIKVNDAAAEISAAGDTASITLDAGTTHGIVQVETNSENAKYRVLKDGADVTGKPVDLQEGNNLFEIRVSNEVVAPDNVISLTVRVPSNTQTSLSKAEFSDNMSMDNPFDPETAEYDMTVYGSHLPFSFEAENPNSNIEVKLAGSQTSLANGKGSVSGSLDLEYGKETVLEAIVTSADGTASKTYTFTVNALDSVYLSDLDWKSASSGDAPDNPVRRDKSCSNKTIKLYDGQKEISYDKGIGTHGKSEIVYDLSGKDYERFTAKVGVDRNVTNTNEPNMKFSVYVDGTKVFETEEMNYNTPYKDVDVDIKGAKELKLVVEGIRNTWSCHADWADARLAMIPQQPAEEVTLTLNASEGGTVTGPADTIYKGQEVTVHAKANEGYSFAGWKNAAGETVSTQADYTFTMESDMTLSAQFDKDPQEEVTLTLNASEGGTVTGPADTIYKGQEVTVHAKANEGYSFAGWKNAAGETVSTQADYTFTMESDMTLSAQFDKDPVVIVLNYDLLHAAINKAEGLALSQFEEKGKSGLDAALKAAKAVDQKADTQQQINKAAADLNNALLILRKTPDKDALK